MGVLRVSGIPQVGTDPQHKQWLISDIKWACLTDSILGNSAKTRRTRDQTHSHRHQYPGGKLSDAFMNSRTKTPFPPTICRHLWRLSEQRQAAAIKSMGKNTSRGSLISKASHQAPTVNMTPRMQRQVGAEGVTWLRSHRPYYVLQPGAADRSELGQSSFSQMSFSNWHFIPL